MVKRFGRPGMATALMSALVSAMMAFAASGTAALAGAKTVPAEGTADGLKAGEVFAGDVAGIEPVAGDALDALRGGGLFGADFVSNLVNAVDGQNNITIVQDGERRTMSGTGSFSLSLTTETDAGSQTSSGTVSSGTTSTTTTTTTTQTLLR